MEILNDIIQTTLSSFDFSFAIVVNIVTYSLIKLIDEFNGSKRVNTWTKRLVLLITTILVGILYYIIGIDTKVLLNSAIIAPVSWSWIFKPLCKKFNIDYKTIIK
jgi:energy-converting hydrogenase Eha subunit F